MSAINFRAVYKHCLNEQLAHEYGRQLFTGRPSRGHLVHPTTSKHNKFFLTPLLLSSMGTASTEFPLMYPFGDILMLPSLAKFMGKVEISPILT